MAAKCYDVHHREDNRTCTTCSGSTRRELLRSFQLAGAAAVTEKFASGQGRCRDGYGTPSCPLSHEVATAATPPVFAPTGWKTTALDRITFEMPDHRKEVAFYTALIGWTLRNDDGHEAVLDIGDWGSAVFRSVSQQQTAEVVSFCFVIEPWNASTIKS